MVFSHYRERGRQVMKAIKERGFEFKGACASSAQGVDVQVMRTCGCLGVRLWAGAAGCLVVRECLHLERDFPKSMKVAHNSKV